MNRACNILIAAFSLAIGACGPPPLGSGATEETSSSTDHSDSTDSGTTSSEPSDTESTTDPAPTTGFVPPSDDLVPSCDPWTQDCPEGEKCVPYSTDGGSWDWNKCVPILGDQAPGEPCTYSGAVEATDDCDATGVCINAIETNGELIGTCWAFCTGTPDAPECPEGSSCKLSGSGVLAACVPTCNPVVQDCDPGLACYWVGYEFNCVFTTQDIPAGEPCGYINDCAPGLICVDPGSLPSCAGPACCTEFCDISLAGPQCESLPGTSCAPFFEEGEELPGYENIGLCIVP